MSEARAWLAGEDIAFNRTYLELKFFVGFYATRARWPFNRTYLELK